jgi:D-3-phosphoglycerate dehydrogenase
MSPTSSPAMTAVSISPTTVSLHDRFRRRSGSGTTHIRKPKVLHPVENEDLRLLLLENISPEAVGALRDQGWRVDHFTKAMSEDELVEKIHQYHAIGIRSKTQITERVLKAAPKVSQLFF